MLKYLCISDLHAGAPTSLLMNLGDKYQPKGPSVTDTYSAALESFLTASGAKPQLILLGDVLDLQFSDRVHSTRNALGFLTALQQTGCLDDEVIITAGNHDHAIWTDARLALETDTFTQDDGRMDIKYRQLTPAFSKTKAAQSRLMHRLLTKAGFKSVDLRYPNIGFEKGQKIVMLHHGHFVETEYRLMTTLRDTFYDEPRDIVTSADVASENAGWIDFFWSSTGDGGLGMDASDFYQNMLTSVGYRRISKKAANMLGKKLSDALPMSGNLTVQEVLNMLAHAGLDVTVGRFRDTERYAEVTALTHGGFEGLRWYLEGPVKSQIEGELNGIYKDITFIFGHTHKPFSDRSTTTAFDDPVKVYNTGGWTLNGPRLDNAEGASMVLIDDALNVASVRLFSTPRNGVVPLAQVEILSDGQDGADTFKTQINDWLAADPDAWAALAGAAGAAYSARQNYLLDLTAAARAAE